MQSNNYPTIGKSQITPSNSLLLIASKWFIPAAIWMAFLFGLASENFCVGLYGNNCPPEVPLVLGATYLSILLIIPYVITASIIIVKRAKVGYIHGLVLVVFGFCLIVGLSGLWANFGININHRINDYLHRNFSINNYPY